MKYVISILIAFQSVASGADNNRDFSVFVGGGLGIGQMSLTAPGNSASQYLNHDFVAEAGLTLPIGASSGLQISGEFGRKAGNNTATDQTYMETASISYLTAKGGIYWGSIAFGAGYRTNQLTVQSLNYPLTGYVETTYSGNSLLGYASISFDFHKRFRSVLEAQYTAAGLTGTGSTTGSVNLSGLNTSLRLFFLFD